MTPGRLARLLAALVLVSGGQVHAEGATRTCLVVETGRADALPLRQLVQDELARHPSHAVVSDGCESWLRVELIEVAEGTFLTARMNEAVPHRERVQGDALTDALERALTVVLHNDPVRLYGPERDDWLRRQREVFRRRGRNYFGLEVLQLAGAVGGGFEGLPGVALTARREVDRWHLGVRLQGYAAPDRDERELHLTSVFGAHVEVAIFDSAEDDTGFFVAGLLGVEHQRFYGPAPLAGDGARSGASATGFAAGARAGVELFRTTDMRVSFFLQANVPAFVASDEDGGVVDQWMPTASMGAGLVF